MRSVRCQNGRVFVTQQPTPTGDGVRVRIRSAGICGSDLHLLSSGTFEQLTIGHELAGVLDDGSPVAVEPILPCGQCEPCRRDDYHLCYLGPSMLLGVGRDGGMSDEIRVPERSVVPLPTKVDPKDACLVEPLAVCIHGLRLVWSSEIRRVAVIGAGSIGLLAAAAVKARGVAVSLASRHAYQAAAGKRLGASTLEGDYDLVIDAAGSAQALETAVQHCRPGGSLLLLAAYWEGLTLPGFAVCMKELRVVPGWLYSRSAGVRDVELAVELLSNNPEIARTVITHRFSLDAAAQAFEAAAARDRGAIKVVLEP